MIAMTTRLFCKKSPTTESDISYNQTSQCLISPNEDYK